MSKQSDVIVPPVADNKPFVRRSIATMPTLLANAWTPLPTELTKVVRCEIYSSMGVQETDSYEYMLIGLAMHVRSLTTETNLQIYTYGN